MEEYFEDKKAIFKYQTDNDWLVLNKAFKGNKGFEGYRGRRIYFSGEDLPIRLKLKIPGEHNRENAAAAMAVGKIIGISETEILNGLANFNGVASRLETIATIDGVEFINDTTSTTPIAGATALKAMVKPVILIAGGASKNLDPQPFAEEIVKGIKNNKIKKIIWLKGNGTQEILSNIADARSFAKPQDDEKTAQDDGIYEDFAEAINKAAEIARPGEVVLLSPGCASFSMFKNEFDRGEQFNNIVRQFA